jgi:hypothetical protein
MIIKILKNQKGIALIWTAIFSIASLGFVALAVDLSFSYVVSTELKSVADAAALTAASSYLNELRESVDGVDGGVDFAAIRVNVQQTVNAIVGRSRVLNLGVNTDVAIQIQYGRYQDNGLPYDGSQFTDLTGDIGVDGEAMEQISAFRVIASRSEADGNALPFNFAAAIGVEEFALERDSVAILAPRNFVLVIDTSGSMDDLSYVRPEGEIASPPWSPEESFIIYPPAEDEAGTPWFSPHSPSNDAFDAFNPVVPQPLQVVLDSSFNFVERLVRDGTLGDSAGVNYFSGGAVRKIDLTSLTALSLEEQFTPLLTNETLYNNLVQGPDTDEFGTALPSHFRLPVEFVYDFVSEQYNGNIAIPNGHTNIGGAIDAGLNSIANAVAGLTQSISVIVLFTDGQPDCAPIIGGGAIECFGSDATSEQRTRAREYAFERATAAIGEGVVIYPISYGNLDEETLTLLDEIAVLSGLSDGHFRAGESNNVEEISDVLDSIFEEIFQLIPFVLVA